MRKYLVIACLLPLSAPSLASPPGIIVGTFVSNVDRSGQLPALDVVPNASISNLSIALPTRVLSHGTPYEVVAMVQSLTYNGQCTVGYTLTAQMQVLDSYSKSVNCGAGGPALPYNFPMDAVANLPGPASVTTTVSFGSTTISKTMGVIIQ